MAGALDSAVFQNTEQGRRLSAANTNFAFNLYKRHASSSQQNVFMSPLSISVALAMTYVGARGQTKSQMKDVLDLTDVEEDHLHQAFTDILSALNKPQQSYKLYMANRLFADKSYTFLDEFLAAGRKHYAAELAPVDFRADSSAAAATINKWVADNTNNKVTEIVSADSVNALTRLVLVNAVYFKGDWLKKFDEQSTQMIDFHVSPKEKLMVKTMQMKAKFYYGVNQELKCQALELPYTGDSLSMFIILPDHPDTNLAEVEKKLTSDDLVNVTDRFQMAFLEVSVWLPKFRLDEKMSVAEALSEMGMKDLFVGGVADLSGVDGTKELFVSKVLHRAVVDVNEEGTEAAAATAVVMMLRCASITKQYYFRADHPFIFFIQHKPTKSILFLGRLVKPPTA